MLRTVPGIVIRDQLGGASRATIAIRGAGSSNAFGIRSIRLPIDGIPKNNAGGSGQDLGISTRIVPHHGKCRRQPGPHSARGTAEATQGSWILQM